MHMQPQKRGTPGSPQRSGDLPSEHTSQEAAYLKLLGEKKKPICVKLADGEMVRGWIEYYDSNMIRLTRDGKPNLFIYKHDIVYIAEAAREVSNKDEARH